MERIEVELLTGQHNYAVVKLPNRRFPGVVFQGDSLSILVQDTKEVQSALERGNVDDAAEDLREIVERLQSIKSTYEQALKEHGLKLPYA